MRRKFSLILQRDSMQCGASCLAMICSYFEKNECIEYLSEQCFATTERVSLPHWTRRSVSGCISAPTPCRTIGTKGLFPIRSSQGRYFIRLQIWRGYWKRVIAHRQEKTLLSYRNCIHHVFYEKYVTDVFSCFCRLPCMKRRKLYENLQINTNLSRNREKNSIDGTYGHIHVKKHSHEYAQRLISVHFTAV